MQFYRKLSAIQRAQKSLLSIGLDSDKGFAFNKRIVEATHDVVCAYKPNCAFYEASGAQGIMELKKTCDYIRKTYPQIVLIIDAKRGDIGSSNHGYAAFVFDYLGGDAVTLNPYVGREALLPFLDRKEKGSIILCRTSNPGSGEFQDSLFKRVARNVAEQWNGNHNCALVVGATYPAELAIVRRIVNDMPILIPGIGTQGGDLKHSVQNGVDKNGAGIIINASRSIIFADNPRLEAQKLRDEINMYRTI